MTTAHDRQRTSSYDRRTRILLVVMIVILVLLLCGLLYVLRSVTAAPEREPVLAEKPGIELVFQSFVGGGALGEGTRPFDVAYDGDDVVYVTLPNEGRVLAFDKDGSDGRVFVEDRQGQGDTRELADYEVLVPAGIDVGPDGLVYVADRQKMAVVVFSPQGEKVREVLLMSPKCIEVTQDRLYVLSDTSTLYVLDLQGNILGEWGTKGRGPDQMYDPAGITVDEDGIIYISDTNNYRVFALSPDLDLLWQFGGPAFTREEHNARELGGPAGITLGADGNIYVVDGLSSMLRVFDRSGNSVSGPLGAFGQRDDEFALPIGIDWIEDDVFVIADTFHDRIVGVRITPQAAGVGTGE